MPMSPFTSSGYFGQYRLVYGVVFITAAPDEASICGAPRAEVPGMPTVNSSWDVHWDCISPAAGAIAAFGAAA